MALLGVFSYPRAKTVIKVDFIEIYNHKYEFIVFFSTFNYIFLYFFTKTFGNFVVEKLLIKIKSKKNLFFSKK